MGEKKEELITAQYKLNIHCKECARSVEQIFYQHEGVRKVEVDVGKGIVTVKGIKIDVVKIREVSERKCRRKVHLLTPIPEKKEQKKEKKEEIKKEEIFTYDVKIFMHCGRCETLIKEEIMKHKSVYSVKTDRKKHISTVVGTIKEEALIEHIKQRTRKNGTIISKKVEIVEEKKKEEVKEGKGGIEVKKEEIKIKEKIVEEEIKHKEVVAPYFIPCSHPRFVDYSHPDSYNNYGGCGYTPHHLGYGRPEHNYRDIPEFKNLNYPPFLHCTHSPEFINDENPYACSVM